MRACILCTGKGIRKKHYYGDSHPLRSLLHTTFLIFGAVFFQKARVRACILCTGNGIRKKHYHGKWGIPIPSVVFFVRPFLFLVQFFFKKPACVRASCVRKKHYGKATKRTRSIMNAQIHGTTGCAQLACGLIIPWLSLRMVSLYLVFTWSLLGLYLVVLQRNFVLDLRNTSADFFLRCRYHH